MRLTASLMSENRYHELLAIVDVESDTAQLWGETFKRKVTGIIRQVGPIWEPFVRTWNAMAFSPHEEDGKTYLAVRCLQVDHDHYGLFSWVNIEGDVIRLILLERFKGTVEDFYQTVRDRNREVQDYLDKWDHGDVTRNDLRELNNLPRIETAFFNENLPPEIVAEARDVFLKNGRATSLTRNMVV